MSKVAELLREAREKIADPAHWCQQYRAVSGAGYPVPIGDSRAVAWCAGGAVWATVGVDPESRDVFQAGYELPLRAITLLTRHAGARVLADFNDEHTHAEVLDLYDRTIAAAEGEATP